MELSNSNLLSRVVKLTCRGGVCLSVCQFVSLSVCLFVCLSVSLFVCMSNYQGARAVIYECRESQVLINIFSLISTFIRQYDKFLNDTYACRKTFDKSLITTSYIVTCKFRHV